MKVELKKNNLGQIVGWSLVAESKDDKLTLGTIRNMQFWGINTFIKRLAKIGIKIECIGNYPWIYIDKINGKRVTEKFEAEHGFTVAFLPAYIKYPFRFTDITEIFKLIRKYK